MRLAILGRLFSFMTSGLKYHSRLCTSALLEIMFAHERDVEKCRRRVGARAHSQKGVSVCE
jgi:hypothetical protein